MSIKQFFNDLTLGKLDGGSIPSELSFKMIISMVRRRKMLGFTSDNPEIRAEGFKVLKAYEKYLANKKSRD